MPKMSFHSRIRSAQRNLSDEAIAYIMVHGKCFHKAGAMIYFLRNRDIPEGDQANDQWARLEGTAVVFSKDGGTLITAWRNRQNGLKRIKQKPDFSTFTDDDLLL